MLSAQTTDFTSAIRSALEVSGILNAQVVVLDPKLPIDTAQPVIGPRAAFVTVVPPTTDSVEAGLVLGNMRSTISFIPDDADPLVLKGMVARVLPGSGIAPYLTQLSFSVLAVPTGSINVLTELQCQTNGMVAPAYTVPQVS